MIIKTKCIPIKDEIMGRSMVKEIRKIYGDATANKVKLVKKLVLTYQFMILVLIKLRIIFLKRVIGIWNFQKKSISLFNERGLGLFLLYFRKMYISFSERM